MRAMPAAQQLDDMAQAAMVQWLRIVRIDRILDLRKLLDVGAACEERQPVDQELAICGIVFEPERVEPRRRAGAQHVKIGRASCRERGCQYVKNWVGPVNLKKK